MVVRQRSGSVSLIGPRTANEDSLHLDDRSREYGQACAVLAVADGMGGLSAGDVASKTAIEALAEVGPAHLGGEALVVRVALAAQRISDLASSGGGAPMGTTLTSAVVLEHEATIAHVGDSRAYVLHQGALTQITEDHSRVGRLVQEGVLTDDEAMHHPEQNVLERALGVGNATTDVYRVGIGPGDILFLCTDGLHTFVTAEEMCQELQSNASLQAACEHLARLAEERGSQDNITAVAWEYPSPSTQPFGDSGEQRPDTVVRRRPVIGMHAALTNEPTLALLAACIAGVYACGFVIGLLLSTVTG